MRVEAICAVGVPPIRLFDVAGLRDVVVIAGPNGVGKTRLLNELVTRLQNPQPQAKVTMEISATTEAEREAWQKNSLTTADAGDLAKLRATIQASRKRRNWRSSVLRFESDRTIAQIKPFAFSWDLTDPYDESIEWQTSFGWMRDRFQDTVHSLFRLVEYQKQLIANRAIQLRKAGHESMRLEFDDPVEPFKRAFTSLLAPKTLADPSPKLQKLRYVLDGGEYDFDSLSSGEKEVVNIAFDFLLRTPQDCIVFFDEPELHLHPELSYRLIRTLQESGARNQFILCTHSPDIISGNLEQSVVFVAPPKAKSEVDAKENQAVPVSEDDETNQALRLLGHSIGIISLGKRIVLIEGTHASLDKQTYGSILGDRYPGLVLVPSGAKETARSFNIVFEKVLSRSLWGVDFFMLCDRDSIPFDTEPDVDPAKFQVLPRYHLENYFLDEEIWRAVFAPMESEGAWLRDASAIRERMREVARESISYSTALAVAAGVRRQVGNVDVMPSECHGLQLQELLEKIRQRRDAEHVRIASACDPKTIEGSAKTYYEHLVDSLERDTDEWKVKIPGRQVLQRFVARTGLRYDRAKRLYIQQALRSERSSFSDIETIFARFSSRRPDET